MKDWNLIEYSEVDNVTTITLNRPAQLNALNVELLEELLLALKTAESNSTTCLVLKGNGPTFCAGGDIKMMLEDNLSIFNAVMDVINSIVSTLYTMRKITIVALNGAAAGLGLSIALACDIIIAKTSSKVAMNFVGIGLIPDGGGHFFLKNRLGETRTKKIIWEGKVFTGQEASNLGLVDFVIGDEDDLEEAVQRQLKQLQRSPIQALIETKSILTTSQAPHLQEVLRLEREGQERMRQTSDHQEGIKAFFEKRPPQFKGI